MRVTKIDYFSIFGIFNIIRYSAENRELVRTRPNAWSLKIVKKCAWLLPPRKDNIFNDNNHDKALTRIRLSARQGRGYSSLEGTHTSLVRYFFRFSSSTVFRTEKLRSSGPPVWFDFRVEITRTKDGGSGRAKQPRGDKRGERFAFSLRLSSPVMKRPTFKGTCPQSRARPFFLSTVPLFIYSFHFSSFEKRMSYFIRRNFGSEPSSNLSATG